MARFWILFGIVLLVWGSLLPGCSIGSQPATSVRVTLVDLGPKDTDAGKPVMQTSYNPPAQNPFPCSPSQPATPLVSR